MTETNAQTIGWDSRTQYPPYDGQLRLQRIRHVASGANMVAYWHWHSLHYGQETYWKGVLSHDLEPNRAYAEVANIGAELKNVGPRLANLTRKNDVAVLYSLDSFNGIRFMPFSDHVDYLSILHQFYGALYRLNVGVDFVVPQSPNLDRYKLVIVPPLYIASDALLAELSEYVKNGGHVVMAFKSGFANEYSTVRWTMAPGPLRAAAGFRYQEFSNLREPLQLKGDPYKLGAQNRISTWAEFLIPETAEVLASYDHDFFGKFPALMRNRYGKGTLTYEGTVLSDALQQRVVLEELRLAGLTGPDQNLPEPVRVKHATSRSGHRIHFYLNYSARPQTFIYPYASAVDLLAPRRPVPSQLTLPPWSLIIAEETGDGPAKVP